MLRYHDVEWGVPLHDDRRLFEFLVLEGAQAGLAWSTILGKRPAYRRAFARFDPRKAQVVELRYFSGMSVAETAEVLHISENTVIRDWSLAKVWLKRELIQADKDAG